MGELSDVISLALVGGIAYYAFFSKNSLSYDVGSGVGSMAWGAVTGTIDGVLKGMGI